MPWVLDVYPQIWTLAQELLENWLMRREEESTSLGHGSDRFQLRDLFKLLFGLLACFQCLWIDIANDIQIFEVA